MQDKNGQLVGLNPLDKEVTESIDKVLSILSGLSYSKATLILSLTKERMSDLAVLNTESLSKRKPENA